LVSYTPYFICLNLKNTPKNYNLEGKTRISVWSKVVSFAKRQRGLIFAGALLVSVAPACSTVTVKIDETTAAKERHNKLQKERKADPYGALRKDFYKDLYPGPVEGTELEGVLDELPLLYYGSDSDPDLDVPTNSTVLEMAKLVDKEIQAKRKKIANRAIILSELLEASRPDNTGQAQLDRAYFDNLRVNNQLKLYWPEINTMSSKILAEIASLVELEQQAAQKSGNTAPKQDEVKKPAGIVPTIDKDELLVGRHEMEFDDYDEIPPALEPLTYDCDELSTYEFDQPSSLLQPESVKTLRELALLHLQAAMQRQRAYGAIKAHGRINGGELASYDQSALNTEILNGWNELLREENVKGNRGLIPELVTLSVLVADTETDMGENIGRCGNNEVQLDIPEGDDGDIEIPDGTPTDMVEKVVDKEGQEDKKSEPKPEPKAEENPTSDRDADGSYSTSQEIKDTLDRLEPKLKKADASTLALIAQMIVPEEDKERVFKEIEKIRNPQDVRDMIGTQHNLAQDFKYYTAKNPELLSYVEQALDQPTPAPTSQSQATPEPQTSAQAQPVIDKPEGWTEKEYAVLVETNRMRAKGVVCKEKEADGRITVKNMPPVGPLVPSAQLRQSALMHSVEMATNDNFSHTGLDGSTSADRILATGFPAHHTGENIAAGTVKDTGKEAVDQWLASDSGHCSALMSPDFTHLGVGYFQNPNVALTHFWTQNFADVRPGTAAPVASNAVPTQSSK